MNKTGLVVAFVLFLVGLFAFGSTVEAPKEDPGLMRGMLVLFGIALCYFLPAIAAYSRHHRNAGAIAILNFLTGWTVLGWIIAAVWAATSNVETPAKT